MKNIKNKLIVLLLILGAIPHLGFSQTNFTEEFTYEVNKIYPYISISKDALSKAQSIADFKNEVRNNNLEYNPTWVKEYLAVEISATHQGNIKKAISKNATLTETQKELIQMADAGTDISVKVNYIPKNNLTYNDAREINFSFSINPENEASFTGGEQQLKRYLKENAIDKIPVGSFEGYDLATVKFTVMQDGQITNVHIFEPFKDRNVEELLLTTISKMPKWKPAEYANGTKVKQEFALTVGNMNNCNINVLNIRRE